jgi:hypothetical protein
MVIERNQLLPTLEGACHVCKTQEVRPGYGRNVGALGYAAIGGAVGGGMVASIPGAPIFGVDCLLGLTAWASSVGIEAQNLLPGTN